MTAIPLFDNRCCDGKDLVKACSTVGFFYLSVHELPSTCILGKCKQLFDLPIEEKLKLDISNSTNFRGYGAYQSEITLGKGDCKETFDLGPEDQVSEGLRGPNQWPDIPGWKDSVLEYASSVRKLGDSIVTTLAEKIGSDFDKVFKDDQYWQLRMLKYPRTEA